jgi:quinol monooxygenase YgiN
MSGFGDDMGDILHLALTPARWAVVPMGHIGKKSCPICTPTLKKERVMATQDKCCSIVPYFKVQGGNLDAFKALCEKFVEKTNNEQKCLYYGFCFEGDQAHCREGYEDAQGLLAHLDNVGPLLEQALQISRLTRLEIHGPEEELAKLREPLANMKPQFFTLEYGFRR